nr:MAG TPA: hypothetical protein [Caudoviricetes sp.]
MDRMSRAGLTAGETRRSAPLFRSPADGRA